MKSPIPVVGMWLACLGGLVCEWNIWRGSPRSVEFYQYLARVVFPFSAHTQARLLSASAWIVLAQFSVTTGMGLLLFVFPEQRRSLTGETPPILIPFTVLFFIFWFIAGFIVLCGRPMRAIPPVLRDKVHQ